MMELVGKNKVLDHLYLYVIDKLLMLFVVVVFQNSVTKPNHYCDLRVSLMFHMFLTQLWTDMEIVSLIESSCVSIFLDINTKLNGINSLSEYCRECKGWTHVE